MDFRVRREYVSYTIAFAGDAAAVGCGFALSRKASELGASSLSVGLLSGLWFLVYTVSCLWTGRFSERAGRRSMIAWGSIVFAVLALACSFTDTIWILWIISAVMGLAVSAIWPPHMAWIGEGRTKGGLTRVLPAFSVSWNLGILAGRFGSGYLFTLDPDYVFYACAVLSIIDAAIIFIPTVVVETRRDAAVVLNSSSDPDVIYGFLKAAWVANFSNYFAISALGGLFPKLAVELGIPADIHGMIGSMTSLATVIGFICFMYAHFWHHRFYPQLVTQLIVIIALCGITFATSPTAFSFCFFLAGINSSLVYYASYFYSLEAHQEKGKGTGIHEAILGGGIFTSAVAGGILADVFGTRSPYVLCVVVMLVSILVQWLILRKKGSAHGR